MKSLAYLNKYFVKYRLRFALGIIFIIVSSVFNILMPRKIKEGVDEIQKLAADKDKLANIDSQEILYLALGIGGAYVLFSFIKGFFLFLTRQTIIVMSRLIEYDLKNEIYEQYQNLSTSFYKRKNTGDLMNRISEDVSKVRMYLGPAVMYTINLLFMFIFSLVSMLMVSPELTLYVLSPLPIMSVMIYYVSKTMNKRSEMVQVQQSHLSTMAQEAFSGIRVLKAFRGSERFAEEFDEACEDYKTRSLSRVKVEALFMPTIIILIGLSTIVAIYVGGLKTMNGEITVGDMVMFVIYVNMLTWPFASVGWVTSIVQRAAASQKRINEFLLEKPEITNTNTGESVIEGNITFKDVSFTYPDSGIQALNNISFDLKPGKTLAIIGRTGSGKSTIANLVCRLYDTSSGSVLIDGKDIASINLNDLRSQIGYVPQEVFLFSDTISENIAFGLKDASDHEMIKEAARKADLLSNIMGFQNQFDTILGERGITLSGGQKQRLSIARALIKDPKILIFDDCLSAVDTETEETILKSLREETVGKTAIIISHRVSSVKDADYIIVLDAGELVEEGSHDDLMKAQGVYHMLFNKQLIEEQKKPSKVGN